MKKVLNRNVLYIFDSLTLCFGHSFTHSWHSLNRSHEVSTLLQIHLFDDKVFTWNGFQPTGVPCQLGSFVWGFFVFFKGKYEKIRKSP